MNQPLPIETIKGGETRFQVLKRRLREPKVYLPIIGAVLILAVAGSLYSRFYVASENSEGGPSDFLRLTKTEKTYTSDLDGLKYTEDLANRHTLGIMIENHPQSRPQAGLTSASVVYEAIAEGGITRFLALYGPKIPEKAGPVRSARTYYLDWCLEYDCFFAHVGGNIDALDMIPKIGIKDLDQFRYGTSKYGKTYYREPVKGVATEHTMFTDPAKLYDIAKQSNWPMIGGFPAIDFKNEVKADDRPASQTIDIEISSKQFNTSWQYDPETNSYARSMGGTPHKDRVSGEQIKSKVLIVQEVASRPTVTRINESGLILTTVGTGKAKVFQDGTVIEGTWKKTGQKERTIFYDASGKEIQYNPGQRWFTIVNPGSKVTVTSSTPIATP